ncbi:copper resistance protein [Cupriavidus pauculus]|uniref:Copper resistance protein n=1 Tax=Cupriavidus pauculus TaxID=82633 RepID=A0A5P2HEW2_9BURK|nr:copper resistance protein [Cupriavidus pauculus]
MRELARRHPWVAGFLVVVFLSVQLATAAYACNMGASKPMEQAPMEAMVSCADMAEQDAVPGDSQKALCMGHCQADTKHADHAAPQIPAFIPVLASIVVEPPMLDAAPIFALRAKHQPRAPPPPHAILHCCLRT